MARCITLIIAMLILQLPQHVFAQERTITGTVLSPGNTPIEGATVGIKGTSKGTLTDQNGKFKISADPGDILVVSTVGFTTSEIKVGNSSTVSITLQQGNKGLQEVVVTALGIKKDRRALGYSVSELNAKELMKNENTNVINSLVGKVPGVNITQFSGAAGAGASITIRGGTSTSEGRQNQPLIVVDGIIYDNSTTVTGNTGTDGLSRSNTTYSDRIMDIDPEDIASLSVLKGAAAAALYGSRAADGVIIITTKKGQAGSTTVNVNSQISTTWADKLPKAQTEFGPGAYSSNGVLDDITYSSWGPKIPADSTLYNNIGNFFQHGITYNNNVSLSGGTKNSTFYISGSNYKQAGIVPNTDYDKTTFRFNGEQKYGHLTLDANVAYSIANTNRTLTTSGLYDGGGNGTMGAVYGWPQT
ncbi:MAG: TonB-dependent receptor plug domain-containing protein, partial [Chitinophagaceae bacterium]